jgi:serpin B
MTLVLPDDLATFEAHLTLAQLERISTALDAQRARLQDVAFPTSPDCQPGRYAYELDLRMPRFGLETRASLKQALIALDMRAPFGLTPADFGGITGDSEQGFGIGDVIHQANIDVDEKGTEAAAATAVIMDTTGGCGGPNPARTITLRLDHPFLFVLRDVETGAVLFMGRVVDPSVRR